MRKIDGSTKTCAEADLKPSRGGYYSRCDSLEGGETVEQLLGQELNELCVEIAGAFLRGYSDGKKGSEMRVVITEGIRDRIQCGKGQVESIVDLSLELIHHAAYGTYRRSQAEIGHLISRAGSRT